MEQEVRPVISDSRFYMWRAVFAMAYADDVLVYKEKQMLREILTKRPFTHEQREILKGDLASPKNIEDMFDKITVEKDRIDFFGLARALAWCDGDYDDQERAILDKLQKQAGLSAVVTGLEKSKNKKTAQKLHDVFDKAGFGGLVDVVEGGEI